MGPVMAWTESRISQSQSQPVNNGRERDATGENERFKRRPSSTLDGTVSVSISSASTSVASVPASSPLRRIEGKDALSYANILRSRNKFVDALALYETVLEAESRNVEAHIGKGICFQMQGLTRQAFESFAEAITLDPNNACALTHCGILYKDEGHLLEAAEVKLEGDIHQGVAHYKKALLYNWHYADAMYNLGVAYGELLKFDMAIVMYELALHFNPHCADRDNLDKAVDCYQMALSIKPTFSQSLNNLGVVYTVQGKMDAAASMIEKAIMANPTYAEAYNNLGVLHRDAGNIALAIDAYERCLQIDQDSRNAGQNRLLAMNYIYEGDDDKLYTAHREWGKRFMNLYPQYTTWDNPKDSNRSLVIGYVSPDYFTHSVSYFIEAPLLYHDYINYKVVVYSAVVKADAKTHKFRERVLKKGGIWRDIYGIDEKKVASIVREDKVDILVELTGHTANNRLGMMACRPAPVQITLRVLRVWARILCAIPTSRLVVKCKPFCCDSVRQRFLSTLEELGLESLRVDLLPLILLNHDHMQAYSLMDIRFG